MHRLYLTAVLLLFAAAAPAQPDAPGGVQVSTQSVPARPSSGTLLLNIDKNSDYSRVGFDYSLRWDFKDLASLRPGPGLLLDGVKALTSWDITRHTRLNYYGFRTNPWRLILSDEKKAAGGSGAAGSGGGDQAAAAVRARERKRRLRLSLSPLAEDLRVSFNEDLGDIILKASSNDPQWQKAGKKGRRAFVHDVLSLGIWDAPLPVIRESKAGLEYLSK